MKHFKAYIAAVIFLFTLVYSFGMIAINSKNSDSGELTPGNIPDNTDEKPFNLVKSYITDEISIQKSIRLLLLGGDKVYNNTDTMILINFNPNDNSIKMLSIPRDTKVMIENRFRKINFAYPRGGAKLSVKIVENLLDIDIDYYAFIDIKIFREIIDLLGGVEYNVPQRMYYRDPTQNLYIYLEKGQQLLDGKKAEYLVRYRGSYEDGDITRIKVQQDFLKELIGQKAKVQYIPKLKSVIEAVYDNVETNMSFADALKFTSYINNFVEGNYEIFTLPGKIGAGKDHWYYICDKEKTKALISEHFKE